MAEHLQAADADTAALQARLDALESETHSLREVLTLALPTPTLGEGWGSPLTWFVGNLCNHAAGVPTLD